MGIRFRKTIKLGFAQVNLSKSGLSSISIGKRGASLNIPIARKGKTRITLGIPGTGLSYSQELDSEKK